MKEIVNKLKEKGWLPFFKTGIHTDSNGKEHVVSTSDLDRIEATYQKEKDGREAPCVLGHPANDSPAKAWVEEVKRVGEVLWAKARNPQPEFAESVRRGEYRYVSPAFRANWSLRHIGFTPFPSIKGLEVPEAAFSEGTKEDHVFSIEFSEMESGEKTSGENNGTETETEKEPGILQKVLDLLNKLRKPEQTVETKEEKEHEPEPETKTQLQPVPPTEPDEVQNKLNAAEEKLKELLNEKNLDEAKAFADGLLRKGKVTPNMRNGIIQFLVKTSSLEFSESTFAPKNFLEMLFSEVPENSIIPLESLNPKRNTENGDSMFSESDNVEPEDMKLYDRARKIQAEQKCSFHEALQIAEKR